MRGDHAGAPQNPAKVGLPPRPFLYTIDQVAALLSIEKRQVELHYTYFEGRSIGVATRDKFLARNIAPADQLPEWRIAERELVRWFKRKGFKWYDRGYPTH